MTADERASVRAALNDAGRALLLLGNLKSATFNPEEYAALKEAQTILVDARIALRALLNGAAEERR